MLKEDQGLSSPSACLYFEYYKDEKTLCNRLIEQKNAIQCIVSSLDTPKELTTHDLNFIPFGQAQCPSLADYADGVDTMKFLQEI